MRGTTFDNAFSEPEEHPAVRTEPLEVRMTGRAIPAVVIDRMDDPQRRECLFVEVDRAVDVADRDEYVVEHAALLWLR
jgi:predicted Holliday junction resolvase-like endonuclease